MNQPNRNKTKKICINFGMVPREVINNELFRPTQIQVGARPVPHVFGNCTWITHPVFSNVTYAQIVFASADEKKVIRVVEKYKGKIVDVDPFAKKEKDRLHQWQIEETDNNSRGNKSYVELANEVMSKSSF